MKKLLFLTIVAVLLMACEKNSDITHTEQQVEIANLKSLEIIYVVPSGDLTGVSDANNIEEALNLVKTDGGTVFLTDGDYYTSRNIVVEGFSGTLKGAGTEKTIINAGRKSLADGDGFETAFSTFWSGAGYTTEFATVLQLDNAVGDVTITDLAIMAKDDEPTDLQPDENGIDATYLTTFIEILGGEHNTTIKNIRLEGKESEAEGNKNGMNIGFGIHVMLGSPGAPEKGNLTVKNVDIENIGGHAVLFMLFEDGSEINIDNVKAKNVGRGVHAGGVFNSSVNISNMDITIHPLGNLGIGVWGIPSGLQMMHNTIRASKFYGIVLWPGINNATVFDNKFIDIGNDFAGILVRGNGNSIYRNDYKESGLPGWTTSTPDGPGAIILNGNTNSNFIHEMKFPNGKGTTLCEMIWDKTDNPLTLEYDGMNEIHNYQPCENLAAKDAKFEELEIEPPGLNKLF